MKQQTLAFLFFMSTFLMYAQLEKYPVFPTCDSLAIAELPQCFKNEVKKHVVASLQLPAIIEKDKYYETTNVVFLVDASGKFSVVYVNSPYQALKDEIISVFKQFPTISPATFNNHPIEMQFVFPIALPIENNTPKAIVKKETTQTIVQEKFIDSAAVLKRFTQNNTLFPEHQSELNIPFTHSAYNRLDMVLNSAANSHTAMKPFVYSEVNNYVDLTAEKNKLLLPKTTWFGKKLFNEHMAYVRGNGFWITVNPVVDLQLGKDSEQQETTFNNTRALTINGAIGKNVSFSTSFYESQGKFATYFNEYANAIKPDGGNPAIIPGRGIAKAFNADAYDYPVAEAYLSYSPNKYFNFQLGNGKNFIGDGYRSLFLSDVASPNPFFKINTTFWNIKYTNLFMTMQDVRPELTEDGAYKQKYIATHYLSWNATKKLNIGLFETVIWDNANDRGFDFNYLNPLIFYTAVEFSTGSRAGNSLLGISLKYKLKNIALYSQLIIDDFRVSEITNNKGWWANKNGIQLGAKYYNAFSIPNLMLQAEYNSVRPYTYSHDELNYNYGHNNQPLAHAWGANFNEFIGIAHYTANRWFAQSKMVYGKKGFDFNTTTDSFSYGGNIYSDNDERYADYDNTIGQGNKASIFVADVQVGYVVNPATNLKLFGGLLVRNFKPSNPTPTFEKQTTTWISFGLKTDLFNWYFDF
jgi:hypothetical protein